MPVRKRKVDADWTPAAEEDEEEEDEDYEFDEEEEEEVFEEDDEEEDEEEVVAQLIAEVDGIDVAALEEGCTYSVVGIDGPRPLLRIGRAVFAGEFEDVLGTDLVFRAPPRDAAAASAAGSYSAERSFFCASRKRLHFRRLNVSLAQPSEK